MKLKVDVWEWSSHNCPEFYATLYLGKNTNGFYFCPKHTTHETAQDFTQEDYEIALEKIKTNKWQMVHNLQIEENINANES